GFHGSWYLRCTAYQCPNSQTAEMRPWTGKKLAMPHAKAARERLIAVIRSIGLQASVRNFKPGFIQNGRHQAACFLVPAHWLQCQRQPDGWFAVVRSA